MDKNILAYHFVQSNRNRFKQKNDHMQIIIFYQPVLSLSKGNMWGGYWWTTCEYQASIWQNPLADTNSEVLWHLRYFSFILCLEDATTGEWVLWGPFWTIIYVLSLSHQFHFHFELFISLFPSLESETWNLLVWYFGYFLAQLNFVQCVPKYSLKSQTVGKFLYKFQRSPKGNQWFSQCNQWLHLLRQTLVYDGLVRMFQAASNKT